jgi:hypothetical protein
MQRFQPAIQTRRTLDRAARRFPNADKRLLQAAQLVHDAVPNRRTLVPKEWDRAKQIAHQVCQSGMV